jgi:dolichol kinase
MHLARKTWHMLGVLIMVLIHQRVSRETAIILLLATMLVFVVPDVIRQYSSKLNNIFVGLFQSVIREGEVHKLSGNSYLITGVLLVVLLFPPKIVSLTLLFLAFADPIASCIGILYGKDKILGQKSLQGFLAAFGVCTLATFGYLYAHNMLVDRIVVISLLAGLIGAFSELLPIGKLDDNLTLPVMSALGLVLLFKLFGAVL